MTPACKCSFEFRFLLVVCFVLTRGANASYAAGIDSEQLQFFENRIRPVLVEHCYECHSAESTKLRGELLLDSKPGWEKGGESGPVIVPGNPDESSIISALRHESFEMPPDSKLSSAIVDDFYQWIKMGAPDPRAEQKARSESESRYDRDERRNWWSLRPVRKGAVPNVRFQAWPRGDVDRFILSGLEGKGWTPAKPASKTSWLRRVTYDLTGLPPSPEDVLEFLSDESENAFETVVDRLLESPHFGEQWARHWMDLVRYAETKAFEADYPMPNVYQYRDYLIRAFNDDVPYDRLLLEAVAGDLVSPRLHPDTGNVESVIGPGYLYLTDGQHGPPDLHDDEARIFDDMIDVLGKAFLAQTVACARCHDHKFDAITSDDYYSLYGIIASSRIDYADINAPERQAQSRLKLRKLKRGLKSELAQVVVSDLATVSDDLLAISKGKAATDQQKRWADAVARKPNATVEAISSLLNAQTDEEIAAIWSGLRSQDRRATGIGNLTRNNFGEWLTSGISFEDAPRPPGDFIVANDGDNVLSSFAGGRPAAGHLASRFAGSIRSPRFTIEGDDVSVRVKGKNVRVSLYVRHYELIGRGPTTGGTTKVINSDEWTTVRFKTDLWIGEPAYIEVQQNGGEMKFDWATGKHVDGAYGVLDAATNNQPLPPLPSPGALLGIRGNAPETLDGVVDFLAAALKNAAAAWQSDSLTVEQSDLLQALHEGGVLDFRVDRTDRLEQKVAAYRKLQSSLPTPTYVRTLTDGHGIDEPVYIRGSHKNLSDVPNPRHFLDGVDVEPFGGVGSGRKEWAETLIAGDNPLTARVAVNRIWHHLFGRGIVPSVDDFGHMGDTPSNPALLDHITGRFVENGWSTKRLIRQLVLSNTYRMSTDASAESLRDDPENALLQHMPVRRLQAESIRDTLLAVSGQLDAKLYGPSQKGDGGNRRSVYIQLRRRFMPEFLMTFDLPNSTETFGRRNITAGPTQSLALMNGEISWKAAEQWAKQITSDKKLSLIERVDQMHLQAFGRHATNAEQKWAALLMAEFGPADDSDALERWKQLCHTMLNRKELIYVY